MTRLPPPAPVRPGLLKEVVYACCGYMADQLRGEEREREPGCPAWALGLSARPRSNCPCREGAEWDFARLEVVKKVPHGISGCEEQGKRCLPRQPSGRRGKGRGRGRRRKGIGYRIQLAALNGDGRYSRALLASFLLALWKQRASEEREKEALTVRQLLAARHR